MTKPVIIGAIVAVAIVLGGGYVLMNKSDDGGGTPSSQASQTGESTTPNEQADTSTANEASFASISSGGAAKQCTFSYSGSEGTGIGTMYSDGKGRGRMTIKVASEKGNTGETNTLVTTDEAYTWFATGSGQSLGFVYDKSSFENRSGSNTTSSTGGTDPSKKFTMNCKDWKVDEPVLTPPANVKFTSFPVAQ